MSRRIRPHVLGIVRRGGDLLVAELSDPATGERFYRPPGGGIEFGEASTDAVVREFREELDRAVEPTGYLGTVENRFEMAGERGHELAVVHAVEFVDGAVYDRELLRGVDDGDVTYEATWEPLSELVAGDRPLYPEGLDSLLRGGEVHVVN